MLIILQTKTLFPSQFHLGFSILLISFFLSWILLLIESFPLVFYPYSFHFLSHFVSLFFVSFFFFFSPLFLLKFLNCIVCCFVFLLSGLLFGLSGFLIYIEVVNIFVSMWVLFAFLGWMLFSAFRVGNFWFSWVCNLIYISMSVNFQFNLSWINSRNISNHALSLLDAMLICWIENLMVPVCGNCCLITWNLLDIYFCTFQRY